MFKDFSVYQNLKITIDQLQEKVNAIAKIDFFKK